MELTFDDNKMQFYPTVNAIYELLQSIVEKISNSLPGVRNFKLEICNSAFVKTKCFKIKIDSNS